MEAIVGNRERRSNLTAGLILIALGGIFLAEQMGLGAAWALHRNWPVLLLVIGAAQVLVHRGESMRGGVWLLLIGTIFMMVNWRVMTWDKAWPLFIVAAGVAIMVPSRKGVPRE
jgi:hypothetical protein